MIEFPKLDKRALSIAAMTDDSDEKEYWLARTPYERMEALEVMRQIIYGYNPATTRLSRVLEITERIDSKT